MIRAAVVGATGYAGAELVRILAGHPGVELAAITSRQYAGTPISKVYPALEGHVDILCEEYSPEAVGKKADVVFTALPHKLPMEIVPELVRQGKRVVDLSADFRFRSAAAYEAAYQPHTAIYLMEKAVYGLSEIYRNEIKGASVVGNPGCYPTSVLLPLIPLIKAGLIDTGSLVADSKSGVSGAGRSPSLTTLFSEVHESFKSYKVAAHRHNPEMDEVLTREAGDPVHITFVPHLVPMNRGMLSTIYAVLKGDADAKKVGQCLSDFYEKSPFVRICTDGTDGRIPDTLHVRGTNHCDIGFRVDEKNGRLVLMSVIDNLVKGAAGQAVQNMNIMFNTDETAGLAAVPYPI